jgi:hypothetical protein
MNPATGEALERRTAAEATSAAHDERTGRLAEEQKAAGAKRMAELGSAVHEAADRIGRELPEAARYVHSAADAMQHASSALRDRSIEGLLSDFSGFARRQPAAAFATAMLAGFALSRFLKSSAAQESNASAEDTHGNAPV